MNASTKNKGRWGEAPSDVYWDTPQFLLGDAAAAAGLKPNVLKAWLTRKIVNMGRHDHAASGKGSSRLFTLRSVLSIALTAELVRLGLPPARAVSPADNVTELKKKIGGRVIGASPNTDCLLLVFPDNVGRITPNNSPGRDKGPPVLATFSGEDPLTPTAVWTVVPPDQVGSLQEWINLVGRRFENRPASVAAVSIPAVLERVKRVLLERGKF